eukprot:7379646-Prymnesium_polylepis.1
MAEDESTSGINGGGGQPSGRTAGINQQIRAQGMGWRRWRAAVGGGRQGVGAHLDVEIVAGLVFCGAFEFVIITVLMNE